MPTFSGAQADATLPTFVVIGAMKAGTTSLWRYLDDHPDIFMASEKELDYFVAEKTWRKGPAWYAAQFAGGASHIARGEASTSYSKHPFFDGVPQRLVALVPDVRIVYVVRHPVDRIVSQYRHALRAGWERVALERALELNPQYVDISSYAMQIDQYLRYIDRERVLFVVAEDLRSDRRAALQRIFSFLGVDPTRWTGERDVELHVTGAEPARRGAAKLIDRVPGRAAIRRRLPTRVRSAYHRLTALDHPDRLVLSDGARAHLLDRLRPDVERLSAIVGDDVPHFDGWGLLA
jgi:hypothetical protein